MPIDPTTLAVIKGRLEEITDEMDLTLYRAAFCPVIAEGHDACHGLYDRDTGATMIQGKQGLPIFVGAMQFAVKAVIDRLRERGEEPRPGDMFIFNDPYAGGTHLQDVKFVRPFFYRDRFLFWLANTGHLMDVGGAVPGGFNPRATDCFQEGFMMRPARLMDRGVLNEDLIDVFVTNSRMPTMTYGDLNAMMNSLQVGERRLTELFDRYGPDTVMEVLSELRRRAADMMRQHIAELPDGTYSFEDWLDNDGVDDRPLRVALDLTICGDRMVLDFSRTDPPCRGPLNIARSTTVACCYVALKHLFPDVPSNSGCLDAIDFIIPETTLLNVAPPRPVGGYLEVILRVIGSIFGAMSQASPERTYGAPFGTVNCLAIGGPREPAGQYVMFCYFGGGLGGSPLSDGLHHGNNPISTATIMPVEILESLYPVLFEQWALRPDSAGPGMHRGGCGAIYSVSVRSATAGSFFLADRGKFPPFGAAGGGPAATNRVVFSLQGREYAPPMISKVTDVQMVRGDRVTIETPGGGGYGDPLLRPAERVAADVRAGYITPAAAARDYGVVCDASGRVDPAATERRRDEMRAARLGAAKERSHV